MPNIEVPHGDLHVAPHTLRNLGPLTSMAGVWEGNFSLDVPPKPEQAPERQRSVEHTELHPIDPQTNGPTLLRFALPAPHRQAR